jgi:hypothetical protein
MTNVLQQLVPRPWPRIPQDPCLRALKRQRARLSKRMAYLSDKLDEERAITDFDACSKR